MWIIQSTLICYNIVLKISLNNTSLTITDPVFTRFSASVASSIFGISFRIFEFSILIFTENNHCWTTVSRKRKDCHTVCVLLMWWYVLFSMDIFSLTGDILKKLTSFTRPNKMPKKISQTLKFLRSNCFCILRFSFSTAEVGFKYLTLQILY